MSDDSTTDFGFRRVSRRDKARHVRGVFDSVAERYDLTLFPTRRRLVVEAEDSKRDARS